MWLHPACPQCCKMVSGVQSALYFHTSVESNLHFKATQRGTGEEKTEREGRGRERKKERLTGPWLSFDLIFIKQENIKVKWIKVWIFVPSGHCRSECLLPSGRAGKSSPHPAARVTDRGTALISDLISSFQSHSSFCFFSFVSFVPQREGNEQLTFASAGAVNRERAASFYKTLLWRQHWELPALLIENTTKTKLKDDKVLLSVLKIAVTSL